MTDIIKSKLHTKEKGVLDYSLALIFNPEAGYGWKVVIEYEQPLELLIKLDPEDNRFKITEPLRTKLQRNHPGIFDIENTLAEKIIAEISAF